MGGKRLLDEAGLIETYCPSMNLYFGANAKSASSQTVDGVPGRDQDWKGTSWAWRGHGGSKKDGVTGRVVDSLPGVGGNSEVPSRKSDIPSRVGVDGRAALRAAELLAESETRFSCDFECLLRPAGVLEHLDLGRESSKA